MKTLNLFSALEILSLQKLAETRTRFWSCISIGIKGWFPEAPPRPIVPAHLHLLSVLNISRLIDSIC